MTPSLDGRVWSPPFVRASCLPFPLSFLFNLQMIYKRACMIYAFVGLTVRYLNGYWWNGIATSFFFEWVETSLQNLFGTCGLYEWHLDHLLNSFDP